MIGIAGAGDDHLALLQRIAEVFVDAEQVERLRSAGSAADVRAVLEACVPDPDPAGRGWFQPPWPVAGPVRRAVRHAQG